MRKCYAIVAGIMFWQIHTYAQAPAAGKAPAQQGPARTQGQRPNMPQIGHIYGKLLEEGTNKPIEYASVAILRVKDSSVVTGMLTRSNGDFSLENLPFGPFIVRINFMGYITQTKKVTITGQSSEQDLGNIKLKPNVKMLNSVEVTGQKSAFQMGIDKKVFNVDRNLTSVGGTAQDVLKSVPSVNVDLDGNVTVRNASPNIFVDGKPSTLTLDQIPADAIESVELVTNPSAKYDAEGMSGILNIVLKKNRKAGFNGAIQAGIGNNNKYNAGGNVSVRQGKINVSANYNINANQMWGEGTTNRTNFGTKGDTNFLTQKSNSTNKPLFQFGRVGLDYYMDNRNTLSLSQNIGGGDFKNNEDLLSTFADGNHLVTGRNNRLNNSDMSFRHYTTALDYRHAFAKPNQELTAGFQFNTSKNSRNGDYITQAQDAAGTPIGQPVMQNNNTSGKTTFITMQSDYTNPIGKNGKLELGVKATLRNYNSQYNVFNQDTIRNEFDFVDSLSTQYKYKEQIYAGYVNFANTIGNFGYQAGLRVEQYIYSGENQGITYKPTKATPGFFPSIFLSQKFEHEQELQLNYSRRVNRPNFFQLIPYRDYSDPQNQREGNPNLKPEYTNSLELSYVKSWKTVNFLGSVYFRNTNNLITTINTPIGRDTLLMQFINANRSNSYGAELTLKNQIIPGWDLTTNVNLYQTDLQVTDGENTFTNSGFSWMGKINSETKLPWNMTLQLNATYQAPAVALPNNGSGGGGGRGPGGGGGGGMISTSAQGTIKGFSFVDAAIRKDFLKNKAASVTLSVSDIFNTRQYELNQITPTFAQDYLRKRESRIFKVNFSYRFGKFDASLFKKKKRPDNSDNGMDQMGF
ncbi:Outer membrane receptor for ferrienterochelin and colicins [Chitinophaga jiangningensis]|uniref:Outer membrane receptor for ferrienterochelin and colicins n=1 Tax=Chitinophaga jiangningensis TaxID=1419482 RepID=A0A1M7C8W5_9BACT|nr:outer membrane beta-barrel family protein [Chitinophaga jiangningensis]SHL63722.1 Outer membrane receptor for ferrienterochelin and colicins [Chitinophaga jiangningensis]